ncbi:hypothetical protein [Numidum massiliense]|nr:hypothetical protein [Numidum massiliense]
MRRVDCIDNSENVIGLYQLGESEAVMDWIYNAGKVIVGEQRRQ